MRRKLRQDGPKSAIYLGMFSNNFEKEKSYLRVCRQLAGFVNDGADSKLLSALGRVENHSLVFRNFVLHFIIGSNPAFNRSLVAGVIEVDARLVVLKDLELGEVSVYHAQSHFK